VIKRVIVIAKGKQSRRDNAWGFLGVFLDGGAPQEAGRGVARLLQKFLEKISCV
jgi:hypothetical protein